MKTSPKPWQLSIQCRVDLALAFALGVAWTGIDVDSLPAQASAGNPYGEWRHWGADMSQTRYSPLEQINAENFGSLEVAWTWRGDNFGPTPDFEMRATPIYVDGTLYTVAGNRRQVVAIDPATGETLWTFREPHTARHEESTRQNWGKGVAYGEVDGRGVIYVTSPAYFLHALDAETGRPLEGFGKPVAVEGFGEYGSVDMLEYNPRAHPYDPYTGPDRSLGFITTSTPPLVVNGVVIVGSALMDGGTNQTRIENIPGDILAFDARTGEHKWSFHTVPLPGEYGADTWGEGNARGVGNAASWAPISADPELGLVFLGTEAPTNDYYGGHRPGDNLFANSVLALDIQTGERRWHYQVVHHDIWDWDLPTPPILVDLNVNGREVPALVQTTKFANAYTFNRETGEPVWPIVETPVPQSQIPGERTSPTQPIPSRPQAWEIQGITTDDLVDFTPELRAQALEIASRWKLGPLFNPPLHQGNPEGLLGSVVCPAFTGGTNATGGTVIDAETGIMYVSSVKQCNGSLLIPAVSRDEGTSTERFLGKTLADWSRGPANFGSVAQGLPILKPPYGRITAIDMNTGETLWWIPNGDTPDRIRNHPALAGVDLPNTGQASHANPMATRTLLLYGEGRGGRARLHAVNKQTGEEVGVIELPALSRSAPMTYLHEGKQYIIVPVAGAGMPGSFVALALPD